jgi:hypothetical protein
LTAFDDGSGPALFTATGEAQRPYRWREGDGQWTPADNGLPPEFFAEYFVVLDDGTGPRLFVFGGTRAEPRTAGTARWTGSGWEFVWPLQATGWVRPTLSVDLGDGMAIYGTQFPNGATGGFVVKWAGDHWETLGERAGQGTLSMYAFDGGTGVSLYIGGGFNNIGGVPVPNFARWTGQQWVPAGDGTSMWIAGRSYTFDDGNGPALYGIGSGVLHGQLRYGLVRFDGAHWSVLGEPPSSGFTAANTLDLFDNGTGPAFYVGGSFPSFGGIPARNIARFDGHTWTPLGAGVQGGGVKSSAVLPSPRGPSLFVMGNFTSAGAGSVLNSARWVGCPNCYANCDLSTAQPTLNVSDFICFLNRFAARDPYANCTVDASIDVLDFSCFLTKFTAGCP